MSKETYSLSLHVVALLYNAFLLCGTVWLVQYHHWSLWTFLFTVLLLVSHSDKKDES